VTLALADGKTLLTRVAGPLPDDTHVGREQAVVGIWLDEQGGMSGGGAGGSPVVVGRSEVVINPGAEFAVEVCGDMVALP
jgi:hypothetical protein